MPCPTVARAGPTYRVAPLWMITILHDTNQDRTSEAIPSDGVWRRKNPTLEKTKLMRVNLRDSRGQARRRRQWQFAQSDRAEDKFHRVQIPLRGPRAENANRLFGEVTEQRHDF